MNSYEITRVGLPITRATVTDEFLDIITELKSNPNSIGITVSNDAKNAPEGYRILEQNGIIYKQIDVWESDRDPIKATIKPKIRFVSDSQVPSEMQTAKPTPPKIGNLVNNSRSLHLAASLFALNLRIIIALMNTA